MMRFWITFVLTTLLLMGRVLPFVMEPSPDINLPGITILDEKHLDFGSIDGVPFRELSDLVYLPSRQKLFMISDKGALFGFHAVFDRHITLKALHGYRLKRRDGKILKKHHRDSEGLTRDKEGNIFVSFEGEPRVAQIDDQGRIIRQLTLPKALRSLTRYRGRNKGLEALAYHPRYGFLVAKERPRQTPLTRQALYSLSGRVWHFRAEQLPQNSVTAIEVMDDGNVMVLERSFDKKHFIITITLKKVYLDTVHNGMCRTKILAKLRSDEGWLLDNFEGLARIAPHRYVMVSDDGGNVNYWKLKLFVVGVQFNKQIVNFVQYFSGTIIRTVNFINDDNRL